MSGVKVTAIDVEKTAIVLEDGARISVDLVIGADGVHFNVTCTHPKELSDNKETLDNDDDDAAAIAYNQKASFSTVQSIYSDFDPVARQLLELPDPDGFRIWKLVDMDDIPNWSSTDTALLGDACHPVSPFGFPGTSMAIEDALTLSTLLPVDILVGREVEEQLRIYQEIRKPRVDRVREQARKHARGER
ncbi:hypothetical protein ABVK25_007507 [Lepraria finkii]|uniref:FAD-binding domain-containing protein n=1 Tax=Lepraria finkii TaxID=1340010 RepID=A0ABR4B384_9LECA